MGWESLAGGVAGAGVGGLIGGTGTPSSGRGQSNYINDIRLQNFEDISKGQSGLEANTYQGNLGAYADLQSLIGAGPGMNEVSSNTQFQNQYAQQLQQLMSGIANPNQQQNFKTAQQYFAPQQTALNQQFEQQGVQSNRLAARLGRAGNDPILRNKLSQEQTRQQTMLNSQIGQFGQELPAFKANQIMGVGNALSNLRGGLATQAMNNRSTLLSMGQQLNQAERNYRIQTARKIGGQSTVNDSSEGGGLGGMLSGGLSGMGQLGPMFGEGLSAIGGLFGGGAAALGTSEGSAAIAGVAML